MRTDPIIAPSRLSNQLEASDIYDYEGQLTYLAEVNTDVDAPYHEVWCKLVVDSSIVSQPDSLEGALNNKEKWERFNEVFPVRDSEPARPVSALYTPYPIDEVLHELSPSTLQALAYLADLRAQFYRLMLDTRPDLNKFSLLMVLTQQLMFYARYRTHLDDCVRLSTKRHQAARSLFN